MANIPDLKVTSKDYSDACGIDSVELIAPDSFFSYQWMNLSCDSVVGNSQSIFLKTNGTYNLIAKTKDDCRIV